MIFKKVKYETKLRILRGPDADQPPLLVDVGYDQTIHIPYPQVLIEDEHDEGGTDIFVVDRANLEEQFNIIL